MLYYIRKYLLSWRRLALVIAILALFGASAHAFIIMWNGAMPIGKTLALLIVAAWGGGIWLSGQIK